MYDEYVCADYPIAIGERDDGLDRMYEEDFRTPEGDFNVRRIITGEDQRLAELNSLYYPFYLAHRSSGVHDDLGEGAYGAGVIELSYPRASDIFRYVNLSRSGEIRSDWEAFLEKKWRPIYEHVAQRDGIGFDDVMLIDPRRSGKRNLLENKTFSELGSMLPHVPTTPMAIHGTNDPDCIGHNITGGCVRLRNDNLIYLMSKIGTGTQVIIEQ